MSNSCSFCRPEACALRRSCRARQNHTETCFRLSYNTYISYGRRSLLKIPNKAIYSFFWGKQLASAFSFQVGIRGLGAFTTDRQSLCPFFFFLWLPIFIRGATQKKDNFTLCGITVCIAILHKEAILDFEKTVKLSKTAIEPGDPVF